MMRASRIALASSACALFLFACEPSMNHEAKLRPYAPSKFFADGSLAKHNVDGTVDRSQIFQNPTSFTMKQLKRGQSRFQIYCSPCHAENADGHGMVVQHGFLAPPPLFNAELRAKPASFFFDVITQGYGAMYSYADRLSPEDRWAVVSYIRALQLSQHFPYEELSAGEKTKLGDQ